MYIYEGHLGSLYTSYHELSYEETHCDACGDSDWLIGEAATREEAWKLLEDDTDIDGSGGWDYNYVQEFLDENWGEEDYSNHDFDPYEDETQKFIWGVKSWDCLTDSDVCLHTMNDIDLIYLKKEDKYSFGLETIYYFEEEEHKLKYLRECLDAFTKFMVENGYNTDVKPHWWDVFGNGMNTHFDSIEECYGMFKMLVNEYCKR